MTPVCRGLQTEHSTVDCHGQAQVWDAAVSTALELIPVTGIGAFRRFLGFEPPARARVCQTVNEVSYVRALFLAKALEQSLCGFVVQPLHELFVKVRDFALDVAG